MATSRDTMPAAERATCRCPGAWPSMLELLLLLIGGGMVRRKWWLVGVLGLLWMAIGLFFVVTALDDSLRFSSTYFAIPLLVDAAFSAVSGLSAPDGRRLLRLGKAAVLLIIVLLIIEAPWHSGILVGILVGALLVGDAVWRASSAYVVRFHRWRLSMMKAAVEFLIGLWSFVPWPSHWQGEVGADVGTLMIVSAMGLCGLALRIRRLPLDTSVAMILARGRARDLRPGSPRRILPVRGEGPDEGDVIVHVWTPTGGIVPLHRGVERYVAARDEKGIVSTGHAALEAPPDIYISHYPAVEIDRAPSQFARALRATPDNDVPGLFKPSYAEESAEWCPSTVQVRLAGLNRRALRAFWQVYRADATYNLTDRNCSSAVASALDVAIEGRFAEAARSPALLLRLLCAPELWIAGLLRRRAAWMAWTPGIVLDYARAVGALIAQFEPRPDGGRIHPAPSDHSAAAAVPSGD